MAPLDPGLLRDLTEAKADLARHGIVIVRTIETELGPAIMAEVKGSMASSPRKLAQMEEDELDKYVDRVRKLAEKKIGELRDLYVRLLAKLGTEDLRSLVRELEGIEQLIRWERITRTLDPVNEMLAEKGFKPIELQGPESVSDGFPMELDQKWPAAFERFKTVAIQAEKHIEEDEAETRATRGAQRSKKAPRKG